MDSLLNNAFDGLLAYCRREDTRTRLEADVLAPVSRYLASRFAWSVRVCQVVVVLVLLQTAVLLWLLFRELRRSVSGPATVAAAVVG